MLITVIPLQTDNNMFLQSKDARVFLFIQVKYEMRFLDQIYNKDVG